MRLAEKSSTMTAHDWLLIAQSAGAYLFKDVPTHAGRMALERVLEVIRRCLTATGDVYTAAYENEIPHDLSALRVKAVEALVLVERHMPKTELTIMLHCLAHAAETIHRWGSLRNTWAFWTERYIMTFYSTVDMYVDISYIYVSMYNVCRHIFHKCQHIV